MPTYDVTLNGYEGGTDEYDHLVKWVVAPDRNRLNWFLALHDLRTLVLSIDELAAHRIDTAHPTENDYREAGIDLAIDENLKQAFACQGEKTLDTWRDEVRQATGADASPPPKEPMCAMYIANAPDFVYPILLGVGNFADGLSVPAAVTLLRQLTAAIEKSVRGYSPHVVGALMLADGHRVAPRSVAAEITCACCQQRCKPDDIAGGVGVDIGGERRLVMVCKKCSKRFDPAYDAG